MGECSELLGSILTALTDGLQFKDDVGNIINIATEDGNLADILEQVEEFSFEEIDEQKYLLVKTTIEGSDIEIGAFELKDASTDSRANVEADGAKNALYVQSASLISITDFLTTFGTNIESPSQYTAQWRLLQLMNSLETIDGVLDSIKGQTDNLNFDGDSLEVKDTQLTFDSTSLLVKDSQFDFIPSTGELSTKDSQVTLDGTSILVKDEQFNFDGDDLTVKVTPPTATINTIIDETDIDYENNDSVNTLKIITDLVVPTDIKEVYSVSIENPSLETDLEVQLYIKEKFLNGETRDTRWAKLGDSFTVEKSPDNLNPDQTNKISTAFEQVRGAYLAEGLGITIYNSTQIGAAGAFTSRIIVREAGNDS